MKYVIRDDEADAQAPLGGKARGLAGLRHAGVSIPAWFALTGEAFSDSLSAAQRDVLQLSEDTGAIERELETLHPHPNVQKEIEEAVARLCPRGELLAVRSSAADEDGEQHSFAGQLESFLNVPPGQAAENVAAVWRSTFSAQSLAYLRERGLSLTPCPPSVLIQQMVQADAAGVAFGADPSTGRRGVAVVCAVRGLGTCLVSGACNADTWNVTRAGEIARVIASPGNSGAPSDQSEGSPHTAPSPAVLDDSQIRAVAELVWRAGQYLGGPQDIEWAFEGNRLHLLQARPITTMADMADPEGALNIWDNSNIGESYSGVTTPLTFSFARRAYEEVYREFCRLLRVPAKVLADNDDIFRNMLGLIRGRVYYNLLNWYRALALLPGFALNRRFMEQMMGVKEGLPESVAAGLAQATWRDRLRDGVHLAASGCAIVVNHFTIASRTRRFRNRLEEALGSCPADLSGCRADELARHYRDLERRLLPHWDAPLVNDFLGMIFFGVLGKCVENWCPGEAGGLQNDLVSGEKEMISAEPAVRIGEMAQSAIRDPDFVRILCEEPVTGIAAALVAFPQFGVLFRDYLDEFGDRCFEELKLESLTLHDDPLMLARSVGQMARRLQSSQAVPMVQREPGRRAEAEQRVGERLRFHPLRRLLFGWVLKNARDRVRDRENLRFERTRLFARARRIFIEIGRRLHEMDVLETQRDVFYLEVNEILGFIEGTATCTDLRRLAALRQAEFERYRNREPPPGRFETRGTVQHGNAFRSLARVDEASGDVRRGLACSAGVVRGIVRVVADPRSATLRAGEILVAERTDPGWVMLFPAAAGLVVERGSLLSHSAIVARELGLPAVVALAGATRWLQDGDEVELDGSRGTVTRFGRPEAAADGD